jgi:hypothetical protein
MCSQSRFTKNNILCVVCKKTKFGAKKALHKTFLCFLHKTQNISIFCETWHAHIKCQDVHFFNFLNFFLKAEGYAHMCQIIFC